MKRRERSPSTKSPSEAGYFDLARSEPDLPLREALVRFRDLLSADMEWTDSRKARFRRRASYVKMAMLGLTAASTVVLGIPPIPGRAYIALPMVAVVTMLGAVETFYAWRSRWVLMEETQYRLNRIRDEVDFYLVTTPTVDLDRDRLRRFFEDQQAIWSEVSRRWIEFRKLDQPPDGNRAATPAT